MATAAVASVLFLAPGCSSISLPKLPWSSGVQADPTAEALFNEGLEHMKRKRYVRAIDAFQKIKTDHPFSPQLIPAELKLAEAYYLNKQYPEAIAAFKEFQALHPTNDNIPFVVYHLGLAHFDQFSSVDRDQKTTELAKGYFETVVNQYPKSEYAPLAREKLAQCLNYLAEHEFQVATFYMRTGKYPAARDRLEGILRNYRATPVAVKALFELGEAYRLEKNTVKAALAYAAVVEHYPNDPLAKKAREQLAQVTQEKQDPLALLLMRDGRPPPVPENNPPKNPSEIEFVAKKEVVHEEPGSGRGFFRRVLDRINPFDSSEKPEKKDAAARETEQKDKPAREESPGFFASLWSGINPFGRRESPPEAPPNPQLTAEVDASLKQRGIRAPAQAPTPPPADLKPAEGEVPADQKPPAAMPENLLGDIDRRLARDGKNASSLPTPPEPAPIFSSPASSATMERAPQAPAPASVPSSETRNLLDNIDSQLKRKGIEPPRVETPGVSSPRDAEARTPEASESRERTSRTPLPPAEEEKGVLDQLKEDIGRIQRLLNPFSW